MGKILKFSKKGSSNSEKILSKKIKLVENELKEVRWWQIFKKVRLKAQLRDLDLSLRIYKSEQ